MNARSVAAIIPAYNAARFLGPALDSVFNQTTPLAEVIVVDDGSTDGTAAVARSYGSRVLVVEQPRAGRLAARDAGLVAATSDFIAFLDADDIWMPHKTARQLAVFAERPDLDISVAHYQNFWDAEIAGEEAQYRNHPLSQPMSGYIPPTTMAPRHVFERYGGFAADGATNDTTWFARAVAAGARLETLPDVLLQRRLHLSNVSRLEACSLDGLFSLIKTRRPGRS
jgi:glycosyltransferase involved in cell wall biosynthesis